MRRTTFYQREDTAIRCQLCPQACLIAEGEGGQCGVRENHSGHLYEVTYPYVPALSLDPIEKKPLYHFYPGTDILSVGMTGCNLSCTFCQNWHLSQGRKHQEGQKIVPESLIKRARMKDSLGLAFTYSEPCIFYEYLQEAMALADEQGLKNVLVTNGFIHEEPLKALLPFIHAVNLDIKAFREEFYQRYCGGRLDVVLKTAEILVEAGVHLEVTNLIIPTLNDTTEELEDLISYLVQLHEGIPLHLSRYFPSYRLQIPPTPKKTMKRAYQLAAEELPFVYLGNLPQGEYQRTLCPECQEVLLERYPRLVIYTEGGRCPACNYPLPVPGLTNS